MLFNWWKKKSLRAADEWPQFTGSLMDPVICAAQAGMLARTALDDSRFCPRADEDIIAAARLVY